MSDPTKPIPVWQVVKTRHGLPNICACTWAGEENSNGQARLEITKGERYRKDNDRDYSSMKTLGIMGGDTFPDLSEAIAYAERLTARRIAELQKELARATGWMSTELAAYPEWRPPGEALTEALS